MSNTITIFSDPAWQGNLLLRTTFSYTFFFSTIAHHFYETFVLYDCFTFLRLSLIGGHVSMQLHQNEHNMYFMKVFFHFY